MINKFYFFLLFFFYSLNLYSTNISTIDIDKVINSNIEFSNFLNSIHDLNLLKEKEIINLEENLKNMKIDIDKFSLILSDDKMQLKIEDYNNKILNYELIIKKHNSIINSNIEYSKNIILKKMKLILESYMLKNNILLILDKNSYIMSNNQIDITNILIDKLNSIIFNFEYNNNLK